VEFLESNFPAADWRCAVRDAIEDVRQQANAPAAEREKFTEIIHPQAPPPFGHQWDALCRSADKSVFAYLMEMGTGKTRVLIDNSVYLFDEEKIDALVLIAPNGVHAQFVNEQIPQWMNPSCNRDTLVYRTGGRKSALLAKKTFLRSRPNVLRILAMNVESLSHKSGVQYLEKFLASVGVNSQGKRKVLMAVDESTRIKNHNSIRSRNIRRLGAACAARRILTGSPVTKGVEDLYGQFAFLDPKLTGFNSFWTFRNRYCIMRQDASRDGAQYQVIVGYQNLDELKSRIAPWSHRVKKEDCLDLPQKMYVQREVPLSDVQRDLYRQLRRELLLEFEDKTLSAPMAAVRITKLQQILCGHIRFTDDGVLKILDPCPRFDVVREMVDETDGQVIIWARFTADIDRLCETLKDCGVSRYDGRVDSEGRLRSIELFRNGSHRVFVGQPASAGLGLNLLGPETVIYFSNSFDAEHRWQSEDRCHRAGAENKHITYYDLVVPNSIDTHVLKVLQRKKDVAGMTVDDLKSMLRGELE
jgi:hypothetical protein